MEYPFDQFHLCRIQQGIIQQFPSFQILAIISTHLFLSSHSLSFLLFLCLTAAPSSTLAHPGICPIALHMSFPFPYPIAAPNLCQLVLLSSPLILSLYLLASPGSFSLCLAMSLPTQLGSASFLFWMSAVFQRTQRTTLSHYVQRILLLNYLQSTDIQTSSCIGSITLHHLKQAHQTTSIYSRPKLLSSEVSTEHV